MVTTLNRRFSAALDLSRWIAALAVLITHASNIMLVHLVQTPHSQRSPLLYLFVFLEGFGHQSVTIFFVLSGFLVGGRLLDRTMNTGDIEWKRYFTDRLIRVYVVLLPALVLTYLVDRVSMAYTPTRMLATFSDHTTWAVFLGNIFNLQNLYVTFFGSNGPIGTLANEFWYYITFPLLLAPWMTRYSRTNRALLLGAGVALIAIMSWPQPAHFRGFLIWGAGVVVGRFRKPLMQNLPMALVTFLTVLVGIRLVMRREYSANVWDLFLSDVFLSLAFANLMVALRFAPAPEKSALYSPMHKYLAGFSFSLYATHKPLLYFFTSLTVHFFGFGNVQVVTGWQWVILFGCLASVLVTSFLFSIATEKNTDAIRKLAYRVLGATRVERPDGPGGGGALRHPTLGQEPAAS